MILGSQVVTPLEMAHAYNSIEEDGDRVSGTMASSKGGPVAIAGVFDGDPSTDGEPVEDKDGNSGVNESTRDQVISPETAATAVSTLTSVVTSGTGKRAQTGEPTWGKTGTTDDNGDAWFCGATPDITACVWVGHADSRQPMDTEFGGAPVDGGTIPAMIFADVVNAYLSVFEEEEEEPRPRRSSKRPCPDHDQSFRRPRSPPRSQSCPRKRSCRRRRSCRRKRASSRRPRGVASAAASAAAAVNARPGANVRELPHRGR